MENTTVEIWKDIPGYEGKYQASSLGRIKNLTYLEVRGNKNYLKKEAIKKQTIGGPKYKSGGGYYYVNLLKRGHRKSVHRLVAMAFNPEKDFSLHVDHINRIRTDNRPENLEFVTLQENNNRQHHNSNEKHHNCKLTYKDIQHIRDEYDRLCNIKKYGALTVISKGYSVKNSTICFIVQKKSRVIPF